MGDRTDKYLTEWSKKRDAWLRSGRKDDSYLLRGADLSAFREFVISELRTVTSNDRVFLLACDRRADTSEMLRSQDIEAIVIEDSGISLVAEPPTLPPVATVSTETPSPPKPQRPSKWRVTLMLVINVLLIIGMLGIGWVVKGLLQELHDAKSELEKTHQGLAKKSAEFDQVNVDLLQKSRAKDAVEQELPKDLAQRDDLIKEVASLAQNRRLAEAQLKAIEGALAVAQQEISKQAQGRPRGKLKVEFDRLLVKRLLLMLPSHCPTDLAECTDRDIEESVRKLASESSLRTLVSSLPHVVVYPRRAAQNPKMLPLREGQLRKLANLAGDKSDLLVIFCPRLPKDKTAMGESRYQALLGYVQKTLKFPPERLLRINYASILGGGAVKGLTPAERSTKSEANPTEAIWVVRAPGPRPVG